MRVPVIVVTMLVVTTPSEASRSCMSKTEARQHFLVPCISIGVARPAS
jgi:hypothetical protein